MYLVPQSRVPIGASQIAFYKTKCIGCGRCAKACPNDAIMTGDERLDRQRCRICGACAGTCPSEALKMIGRTATVSEILAVVMRDDPFYRTSGGGVTLSGGEPLYQYEFSVALLRAFKDNALHTAVETSGYSPWEKLAGFALHTDLFLYDIKVVDAQKHGRLCHADNTVILANARKLVETGAHVIFRTPIVPGMNDTRDDLRLLAEFILSLHGEQEIELMPYHSIGSGKYDALGMLYPLPDVDVPDSLEAQKARLLSLGVKLAAS